MRNNGLLYVLYTFCIFLALFLMYLGSRKIFKIKSSRFLSVVLVIFISISIAVCVYFIKNLPAVYIIAFFLVALLFAVSFRFSINQALFMASFYVFHVIAYKGIILGCMSLILKMNIFIVLSDKFYNLVSIILTQIALSITFAIYNILMKNQLVRNFLVNKKQLSHILVCHIILLLFTIFNTFSFYYNLDLVWISISQILVSFILYLIYIIVLNYGVHIADLLQHKMRDQKQLGIIQSQLRQQNSLLKITEIVNQFKHDYREQLLTIEECVENNLFEQALKEIKNDCLFHLDKLPHTKKYSNNVIINSLLIDRQDICEEKEIEMTAIVFFPQDLSINERELHELLRIITDNAIDANEKVQDRRRYITINSTVEKQWLNIQIENPYTGIILFDGDRPVSSYEHEDNEGLGLIYVEELLEHHGGMIHYESDKKNKIFRENILIRIDNE